jgi:hypothetical protein
MKVNSKALEISQIWGSESVKSQVAMCLVAADILSTPYQQNESGIETWQEIEQLRQLSIQQIVSMIDLHRATQTLQAMERGQNSEGAQQSYSNVPSNSSYSSYGTPPSMGNAAYASYGSSQGSNHQYQTTISYKKPLLKRPWFWIILVVVLFFIFVLVSGGGGSVDTSPELSDSEFMAQCREIDYEDYARYPDRHSGEKIKFEGEIIQATEDGTTRQYRISVSYDADIDLWTADDIVFTEYEAKAGATRYLEGDIVTVYGTYAGTIDYETIFGQTITVPACVARVIGL